ncbi:uncharacterized protein OCT59_017596 [Rhizophagus irregularis]|uniref:uncharacterized protein n=1 Tax=Rhizophagus irregularis TaxID=588596 RepID=UPI0033277B8B|nr:hypothetical protein OCT59_017596 [Rhizophagus irregularis]
MLRNRARRDTTTLPFRIRNNFRRQPQGTIVPPNDDNGSDNFDNSNEQRNNYNVDMQLENEEYDDDEDAGNDDIYATSSENSDNYTASSENEEYDDYGNAGNDDYATSSENDDNYTASSENEEYDDYNSDTGRTSLEDFTTAALFCWIHKHDISTNAYEDLVDIIMNQEFNRNHIVRNIRRFRTWRQHLPLLSISAKSIPISSKKTPSTSKNSKLAYQLSINDIIWHVLSNPSLVNNMYFGPETYRCGDFVYYYDNDNNEQLHLGRLRAILMNEVDKQY